LVVGVPLSTEGVEIIEPFQAFVSGEKGNGLEKDSKILFNYPMSIDKNLRLKKKLGLVSREVMEKAKVA
jgi:mRNA-degrading endonuclease toxin of MazEF toxin-antitoxin module